MSIKKHAYVAYDVVTETEFLLKTDLKKRWPGAGASEKVLEQFKSQGFRILPTQVSDVFVAIRSVETIVIGFYAKNELEAHRKIADSSGVINLTRVQQRLIQHHLFAYCTQSNHLDRAKFWRLKERIDSGSLSEVEDKLDVINILKQIPDKEDGNDVRDDLRFALKYPTVGAVQVKLSLKGLRQLRAHVDILDRRQQADFRALRALTSALSPTVEYPVADLVDALNAVMNYKKSCSILKGLGGSDFTKSISETALVLDQAIYVLCCRLEKLSTEADDRWNFFDTSIESIPEEIIEGLLLGIESVPNVTDLCEYLRKLNEKLAEHLQASRQSE